MAESFYEVLGVQKGATLDEIKKSYRKLAQQLHPDKNPGNKKAEERFKTVNRAFDVLGDEKKRKLYDEFGEDGLREGFDPDKVRAYKQWASQQGARGGGDPFAQGVRLEDLFGGNARGGSDVSEMFGDLFNRGSRRRGPQKGPDLESQVKVDFASAVRGATVELRTHEGGTPVTVRIPAGADEGSRVRIAGQGGPSPNGGPPGDLILEIHVEAHPLFRREGDDLHLQVPITIAEAYSGAKVKVPTVDGSVSLKVPPRSQSGSVVRLRGKGVARRGKDAGDLYVHFEVQIPTQDDPKLAGLVEQIAAFQSEDPRAKLAL